MKKLSESLFSNWFLASLLLVATPLYALHKALMFAAPLWVAFGLDICVPTGVSIAAVLPPMHKGRLQQLLRAAFVYFFFSVAAASSIPDFIAPRLSGLAFLAASHMQLEVEGNRSGFYFSHLLALNLLAGSLGGLLVNFKRKHAIAIWVWVVPAGVLALKMLTLEGYSLLESRAAFIAQHLFADCHPPNLNSWNFQVSHEQLQSCVDQLFYTAPFYAAVGFSLGAWIARKQQWFRATTDRSSPAEHEAAPDQTS